MLNNQINLELIKDRRQRLAISRRGLEELIREESGGKAKVSAWSIAKLEKGRINGIQIWDFAYILKVLQLDPNEVFCIPSKTNLQITSGNSEDSFNYE